MWWPEPRNKYGHQNSTSMTSSCWHSWKAYPTLMHGDTSCAMSRNPQLGDPAAELCLELPDGVAGAHCADVV